MLQPSLKDKWLAHAPGRKPLASKSATQQKKTKQAPKAAKKGGRKRRGAQASAISPRENDNEPEEEELEEEPFTIDDHDDIDPLAGVTDPLQRMQIKALMAEEWRRKNANKNFTTSTFASARRK
ncbi:hypothetical protein V8E54_009455 [Elaphomyces granulatus]